MVAGAAVSAVAESSRPEEPEEPEPVAVAACLGSGTHKDRAPMRAAVGL